MAYCVHKRGDKTVKLPMVEESSGTNGLFSVLALVLPVLDNGGVAIIDELETDLHAHGRGPSISLFSQIQTRRTHSRSSPVMPTG